MTNQDHVWQVLDDVLIFLSANGYPTPERTYKLDGGWPLALADLKNVIFLANQEIKTLTADLGKYSERCRKLQGQRDEARAERDELRARRERK